MRRNLTSREADLMTVLWDHGPSTVAEVREHIGDHRAYTTILSLLRKLEAMGYITHTEDGRAHRYAPLVERDAARRSALRDLTTKLYKGSAELLLTHFLSDQRLTDAQAEDLRRLIDTRTRRRKP